MTEARRVFLDNGLGDQARAMYRKRRRLLGEAVGKPFLLRGIDDGPGGSHSWASLDSYIFQDPLILYYTGINQPGVAVYVDPIKSEEILFLPEKDPHHEFWEGFLLGVGTQAASAQVRSVTGFRQVRSLSSLDEVMQEKVKGLKRRGALGCFWHQSPKRKIRQDHHAIFKRQVQGWLTKSGRKGLSVENIQAHVWDQCLIMDAHDQALLREANQLTKKALLSVKRALPKLKTESEVAALLVYELSRRSVHGLSFAPIVASGKNATVLHYTQNDAPLNKNGLVLLDFGLRRYALCADQSHTLPVSGKANPLQAMLLRIVKKAQSAVEAAVKPGVFIDDLNTIAWTIINEALEKQILKKGGDMSLPYQDRPHGVSHLIGYQVHDGDPFRGYAKRPLKPGMCLSNEPGIYGYFDLKINGCRYREWIGIRLESDLLVTSSGCENLSR